MIEENTARSRELQNNLKDIISRHEMSFAIINLNTFYPELFGYNIDKLIYPASMSKVFIGAEVLRQIELGVLSLNLECTIVSPNDVDKNIEDLDGDTRKLLKVGDVVTVEYLLDLMLSRSDNTASNCLIDLVSRESINENIINRYNWIGSEVTRKYLDRSNELKEYQKAPVTMSCARHFAECFFLIDRNKLLSPWVSQKLREYMSKQNNNGIPISPPEDEYLRFYSKGGWYETNLYKENILIAIKNIFKRHWNLIRWSNDASVITLSPKERYVLVFFSITKTIFPWRYFPTENFTRRIMRYMKSVYKNNQ